MSTPSAKTLASLESARQEHGCEPELVVETEWSRWYKVGPKTRLFLSKILHGEVEVSSDELKERWPKMSWDERSDFAFAFARDPRGEAATEILEIIMNQGNQRLWASIALALLHHSDRDRAVHFLIHCLEDPDADHAAKANYIQGLELFKDKRAVPVLKLCLEERKREMEAEAAAGLSEDDKPSSVRCHREYLSTCAALMQTDGSPEYEQELRLYCNHPHSQVRRWAKYKLDGEFE